jgi:hypothetical protein
MSTRLPGACSSVFACPDGIRYSVLVCSESSGSWVQRDGPLAVIDFNSQNAIRFKPGSVQNLLWYKMCFHSHIFPFGSNALGDTSSVILRALSVVLSIVLTRRLRNPELVPQMA